MQPSTKSLLPSGVRTCDAEPIHIPGSIQPHGVFLLFCADTGSLLHWAGDVDRLLGTQPRAGLGSKALLGRSMHELTAPLLRFPDQEAVYAGRIVPLNREPLSVVLHRISRWVAVELELVGQAADAATALEQVRRISRNIAGAETLEAACQQAAEEVQSVAGYDRVMVYRFREDYSGSVVAEALAGDAPSYLGHRFPESDIPAQARELYRRNAIRVIPDVSYTPAHLVPPADARVVDMTHSTLRSVSPVHVRYLKNMGVGASMSISLLVDGELWGLIACHHSTARLVPSEAQLLCQQVGTTLSTFIQKLNLAERARRSDFQSSVLEQMLAELRLSSDPEQHLRSSVSQLWSLVESGGMALLSRGQVIAGAGRLPAADALRQLNLLLDAELDARPSVSSDRLSEEIGAVPDANPLASGVLAIRIEGTRPLTAVWTRPEQVEEVSWAGNPHAKEELDDPSKPLTPRRSFATWQEIVRGRSRPWTWEEKSSVVTFKARAEFILQRHRLEQVNKQLAEANLHLNMLATTDPLTGLPNRRLFDERLRTEWIRCLRSRRPLAVLAIDVDNFKKYNDQFGHPAGDECLKQVAQALRDACRTADIAARVGGEEFALLLLETNDGGASAAAERVRLVVEQLGIVHPLNEGGVATISIGLAEGDPNAWGDLSLFLKAADEALYEAKAAGRNRVVSRGSSTSA